MSISKTIDFSSIKVAKAFHNKTKVYETLNTMNESSWQSYTNKMLLNKVSVKYDAHLDAYVAAPLKEAQMTNKKYLLQDEDEDGLDMESNAMDIINSVDLGDEPEVAPETEIYPAEEPEMTAPPVAQPEPAAPVVQAGSPSIDLSQLEALLTKILGTSGAGATTPNPAQPPMPASQTPAPGAFVGNILDTEFENNADNISFIEQKKDTGYMDLIDPKFSEKKAAMAGTDEALADITGVEDDLAGTPMSNVDTVNPDENELNEWGASEYSDYENATTANGTLKEEDEDELNEYENSEMEHYGAQTGTLNEIDEEEDTEEESGVEEEEVGSDSDWDMGEESDDEDAYASYAEEEDEPITAQGTANVGGQAVQIILTGVMITPKEVAYVAESAKKNGMKLKAVKGAGKVVNFIVEANNKTYTIKYEDLPKSKTKTPFSIKNYTFQTLDEAFDGINLSKTKALKEASNFKSLVGKDVASRSITDIKEANILSEFAGKVSKDYIPGWNMKGVGSINLKTGLNETYSNITEHSEEKNTLVKTKDGQFFLIKGNLKERSEVGTKRQLVDLDNKRDFGVGTVVGIYENSIKGLGQVMFKTKRTTLPLLTWK